MNSLLKKNKKASPQKREDTSGKSLLKNGYINSEF
jgi:hypothetical protein